MGKPVVLAINQNDEELKSIKSYLKNESYRVHIAINCKEAVHAMQKHPASILVCHEDLPDKSGLEFLKSVKHRYPDTVRCLISRQADSERIQNAIRKKDICAALKTSWKRQDLLEIIEECVEKFKTGEANRKSMKSILAAFQEIKKDREEDLVLSTAILNVLPQAALVVDKEFRCLISNDIYKFKIAAEGQSIELQRDLVTILMDKTGNYWSEFRLPFTIGRTDYIVRLRPLRDTDSKRAIIFFDPPKGDI